MLNWFLQLVFDEFNCVFIEKWPEPGVHETKLTLRPQRITVKSSKVSLPLLAESSIALE